MGCSLEILFLLIVQILGGTLALWNNLNCPAPRSPENGLSFIFRNGELVHFRCHPGFVMRGKPVSYCINNIWTAPAPECIPVRKDHHYYREQKHRGYPPGEDDVNYYSHQARPESTVIRHDNADKNDMNNQLFDWESKTRKQGVYGDGPRRLPLINGIWPNQSVQIMALGPQSTPGPMELVREEVNIAELRNKQYEEVAHQRATDPHLDLLPVKRRKGNKKRKRNKKAHQRNSSNFTSPYDINAPRETVISLGTTVDGDALSIAFAKNDTTKVNDRHKYRHHVIDGKKRKKQSDNKKKWHYQQQQNVISRSSRVDTSGLAPYNIHYRRQRPSYSNVAEFKRKPVLEVEKKTDNLSLREFDSSCIESFYGRDLPMIAPQVPHAFVYRYETKKNKEFPFNTYMQVKYRCLNGYSFADSKVQVLHCREAAWVGQVPRCVPNKV